MTRTHHRVTIIHESISWLHRGTWTMSHTRAWTAWQSRSSRQPGNPLDTWWIQWISLIKAIKNPLWYHQLMCKLSFSCFDIAGLMQKRRNFSALAMELVSFALSYRYVVGTTVIKKMLNNHTNIPPIKGVNTAGVEHKCAGKLQSFYHGWWWLLVLQSPLNRMSL